MIQFTLAVGITVIAAFAAVVIIGLMWKIACWVG